MPASVWPWLAWAGAARFVLKDAGIGYDTVTVSRAGQGRTVRVFARASNTPGLRDGANEYRINARLRGYLLREETYSATGKLLGSVVNEWDVSDPILRITKPATNSRLLSVGGTAEDDLVGGLARQFGGLDAAVIAHSRMVRSKRRLTNFLGVKQLTCFSYNDMGLECGQVEYKGSTEAAEALVTKTEYQYEKRQSLVSVGEPEALYGANTLAVPAVVEVYRGKADNGPRTLIRRTENRWSYFASLMDSADMLRPFATWLSKDLAGGDASSSPWKVPWLTVCAPTSIRPLRVMGLRSRHVSMMRSPRRTIAPGSQVSQETRPLRIGWIRQNTSQDARFLALGLASAAPFTGRIR